MNMKLGLGAALLAASLLVGGTASAATIITVDDTIPVDAPFNGTLTCSETCEGLVGIGPTVWDTDNAKLFTIQPNGDADELAFVNTVTGSTYLSGTKTGTSGDPFSFVTNALYILLKIGGQDPSHFLIKNTYGAGLTISWDALDQPGRFGEEGAGLSHYVEFGTAGGVTFVPVPAGLPLILSGLGIMAFLARRKARKA